MGDVAKAIRGKHAFQIVAKWIRLCMCVCSVRPEAEHSPILHRFEPATLNGVCFAFRRVVVCVPQDPTRSEGWRYASAVALALPPDGSGAMGAAALSRPARKHAAPGSGTPSVGTNCLHTSHQPALAAHVRAWISNSTRPVPSACCPCVCMGFIPHVDICWQSQGGWEEAHALTWVSLPVGTAVH